MKRRLFYGLIIIKQYHRKVKVPVRSDYIDTAADFNLTLSDAVNCTLGGNFTAKGIVEANSVSYKDTEEKEIRLMADAGVGDVIVSDKEAFEHKSPYSKNAQSDGYTRAEGDNYVLHASTNVYDKVCQYDKPCQERSGQ